MSSPNYLWQYQAKAEPVAEHESIIPSFGWFQQGPDVIRPPARLVPEQFSLDFTPTLPIPYVPSTDHTLVISGPTVIYQAKAEPLEPIVPDFGWFVPPTELIRPLHQVDEGLFVLGVVPIIPSFGWFVVPPDVIRPPVQLVAEGLFVLGAVPILPSFGWFVVPPDVMRPLHQVDEGLFVQSLEPIAPSAVIIFRGSISDKADKTSIAEELAKTSTAEELAKTNTATEGVGP